MAGHTRRDSYNPLLKSYPDSEKINAVSEGAEVLYVRLLAASDDAGNYYGEPSLVLAKLFTHRMLAGSVVTESIGERIEELIRAGLVRTFVHEDKTYLHLVDVFKTRRSDVKPKLWFPSVKGCQCATCVAMSHSGRTRNEPVTDAGRARNGYGPLDRTVTVDQDQSKDRTETDDRNESRSEDGAVCGYGIFGWLTKPEDLRDTARLVDFHRSLVSQDLYGLKGHEQEELRFVGASERALEVGSNPVGMFIRLVTKKQLRFVNDEQIGRASQRLRTLRSGQPRGRSAPVGGDDEPQSLGQILKTTEAKP